MAAPKKSLGQHWLHDRNVLQQITDAGSLTKNDTVLEIGPGLGTLTSVLLTRAGRVVAVEFDPLLAKKLPKQFPGKALTVKNEDILQFDLATLPANYKIVANVPYYITSKIIHMITETDHLPSIAVLLVQKEVAERMAADAGAMSLLSVASQIFYKVEAGIDVSAELFTPPPKVDSKLVILYRRAQPLIPHQQHKAFFRLVKAGFSERRKKLRSSLAGGLGVDKSVIDHALRQAEIAHDARAQELSIAQWQRLLESL